MCRFATRRYVNTVADSKTREAAEGAFRWRTYIHLLRDGEVTSAHTIDEDLTLMTINLLARRITLHHLCAMRDLLSCFAYSIRGTVNLMSLANILVAPRQSITFHLFVPSTPQSCKAQDHAENSGFPHHHTAVVRLHASSPNPLAASKCKRGRHKVRLPKMISKAQIHPHASHIRGSLFAFAAPNSSTESPSVM
jgi:hypothetical protein